MYIVSTSVRLSMKILFVQMNDLTYNSDITDQFWPKGFNGSSRRKEEGVRKVSPMR